MFTAITDLTGTVGSPWMRARAPGRQWRPHFDPCPPARQPGPRRRKLHPRRRHDHPRSAWSSRPFDFPVIANVGDGCDIGAYENHLIALVKSVNRETASVNDTLLYTLSVRNTFSDVMQIGDIADTLWPTPLSFADADGNPFPLPGDLAAGATITATLTHIVADADLSSPAILNGQLVNTATVTATLDPGGLDLDLTDRDDARLLLLYPNLSLQKKASEAIVLPDAPIVYTLRYTNHGPGAAANVYITDTLPLSVTFGTVVAADPPWPNNSLPIVSAGPPATLTWYTPTLPAMLPLPQARSPIQWSSARTHKAL